MNWEVLNGFSSDLTTKAAAARVAVRDVKRVIEGVWEYTEGEVSADVSKQIDQLHSDLVECIYDLVEIEDKVEVILNELMDAVYMAKAEGRA